VIQNSGDNTIGASGIVFFSLTGAILCGAWCSLIHIIWPTESWKVSSHKRHEQYLEAAIYAAEWEALGRSISFSTIERQPGLHAIADLSKTPVVSSC